MDPRTLQPEIERLHASSFAWALSCCGRDHALAQDVLQEVYFKILEGRARYEQRSLFRTWLFGVIRMTAMEHRRPWGLVRLFTSSKTQNDDQVDESRGPDSEVAQREQAAHVARALAALPARQKEVLHLVFYEGMTIAEAAVIMGVSIGSARQHYDRGKQALGGKLGVFMDAESLARAPR